MNWFWPFLIVLSLLIILIAVRIVGYVLFALSLYSTVNSTTPDPCAPRFVIPKTFHYTDQQLVDDLDRLDDLYAHILFPKNTIILDNKNALAIVHNDYTTNESFIYIRGTKTYKDVIRDMDTKYGTFGSTNVDHGFMRIYQDHKTELINACSEAEHVNIRGHSLGAAIALLLTYDLTISGKRCTTILFACPKVGGSAFANILSQSVMNTKSVLIRIENSCDMIPMMPLPVGLSYTRRSNPRMYVSCGVLLSFTLNRGGLYVNHQIEAYRQGIRILTNNHVVPISGISSYMC